MTLFTSKTAGGLAVAASRRFLFSDSAVICIARETSTMDLDPAATVLDLDHRSGITRREGVDMAVGVPEVVTSGVEVGLLRKGSKYLSAHWELRLNWLVLPLQPEGGCVLRHLGPMHEMVFAVGMLALWPCTLPSSMGFPSLIAG